MMTVVEPTHTLTEPAAQTGRTPSRLTSRMSVARTEKIFFIVVPPYEVVVVVVVESVGVVVVVESEGVAVGCREVVSPKMYLCAWRRS